MDLPMDIGIEHDVTNDEDTFSFKLIDELIYHSPLLIAKYMVIRYNSGVNMPI